jgi:hypothetical protein
MERLSLLPDSYYGEILFQSLTLPFQLQPRDVHLALLKLASRPRASLLIELKEQKKNKFQFSQTKSPESPAES